MLKIISIKKLVVWWILLYFTSQLLQLFTQSCGPGLTSLKFLRLITSVTFLFLFHVQFLHSWVNHPSMLSVCNVVFVVGSYYSNIFCCVFLTISYSSAKTYVLYINLIFIQVHNKVNMIKTLKILPLSFCECDVSVHAL